MHGILSWDLARPSVDKENPWHGYNSVLKGEMDSFIIAAHDQAIDMRYHQRIS
jgi:hypothetical protein